METRWSQPFRWGLLMAFDPGAPWELPEHLERYEDDRPQATSTCLTVLVRASQDVEIPEDFPADEPIPEAEVEVVVALSDGPDDSPYSFLIECPSGRLTIGDAENERVVEVPTGTVRVGVMQEPQRFAERVHLNVSAT